MSISNLKWTQGAPKELLPGMVVRCDGAIHLIGSGIPRTLTKMIMSSCTEYAQAIHGYELDWLNNMGVPAKVLA